MSQRIRTAIRVRGIVQGVGFRPFVYSLATQLTLSGHVGNDAEGVFAEVEGPTEAIAKFLAALRADAPPLASIESVEVRQLPPQDSDCGQFTIVSSEYGGERTTLVSADTATCDDCLAELADPADRRYRYPFINCVNCGPRFTIVRDLPYDRPRTTMASFELCQECAAEYHDPASRRFHAQPVCCSRCGPRLALVHPDSPYPDSRAVREPDPLEATAGLLKRGLIVAIKGLGGYHLAVDATSQDAAATLRARKHREDKPFAIMATDLGQARELCDLDPVAEQLLISRRRPVVLAPRRPARAISCTIADAVAPGNRQLGVMLPYTPLHHLLLRAMPGPIVLTSGNVSDEPIAYTDADALDRLGAAARIADAFLTHDRAIHVRTDDSVTRSFRGRAVVIRRARGYAPEPLTVTTPFPRPILACGAELKSTFCLGKDSRAVLSPHLGDLENTQTLHSFTEGIEHFSRLFDVAPELIAHDLHPEYLSTKYARDRAERQGLRAVAVQHHHAHLASCLADNATRVATSQEDLGPVIGVTFDGTGYGTDGTIWGGEFLVGDLARVDRAGHLATVPMPGGAAAIRQPWRMAAAYLRDEPAGRLDVRDRHEDHWRTITDMARKGVSSPLTSSAGRLFDAVAALLGVRDQVSYEGQAAIELEQLAAPGQNGTYPVRIDDTDPLVVHGVDLVSSVVDDLGNGTASEIIAARFHDSVAELITRCCLILADRTGLRTVALSGGVFANQRLSLSVVDQLESHGLTVLTHSLVPCNDGGISLGQAVIAAARDRQASHTSR